MQAVLCGSPARHAGAGSWDAVGSISSRSACGALCADACSVGGHAADEVDAFANAAINSRKNSEFSLFSSPSFCRLEFIAECNE